MACDPLLSEALSLIDRLDVLVWSAMGTEMGCKARRVRELAFRRYERRYGALEAASGRSRRAR